MKRKDVVLDFTPLLDITLILLFFFLLFSTFEVEEAKVKLDEKIEAAQEELRAAEERMKQANAEYSEAMELANQLDEDIKILEDASARQASNIEALMSFNRGTNIKLILSIRDGIATLKIFHGETLMVTTTPDEDLSGIICTSLIEANYREDDTILCEFILDGSEPGTAKAYRKIKQNLMYVKGKFKYFYYSETDLSMGE